MNIRTIHPRAPILALTIATACAAGLPAHAAEQPASKQENIGVSTGLVVGALAGGPFGAVFGAAAGAWLGDRYHRQMVENRRLNLEAQVMFRTEEATLTSDAVEQLKKLGAVASKMPDAHVRVSGYADARGTEEFNSALSKERAEAVAAVLMAAGIDASRLSVEAHGKSEATASVGDLDGNALDRRVVVRIEPDRDEIIARRN